MISEWIAKVNAGHSMTELESADCLRTILEGGTGEELVAELLVALAEKGDGR
jgi:anthranilate phosphoribosyltransferase